MSSEPNLVQGVAPIFGNDRCCYIGPSGHINLPISDFGPQLAQGFYLGIDIQPEGSCPSMLLGTGTSSGTLLVVHYNVDNVKNRIQLDLCDDDGRVLSAYTDLSRYAAKRIIISVDVQANAVRFHEFNIIPSNNSPPTHYIRCESLRSFSSLTNDLILGGASIDSRPYGGISAKVGSLYIGIGSLQQDVVADLFTAASRDVSKFYGAAAYVVPENGERRVVFRDDMRKLHEWLHKAYLTGAETRDASSLLFRWLLDRHPMLQDLCNELGIQLTLPAASEARGEHERKILREDPVVFMTVALGKQNLLGHEWVPREAFLQDNVMSIKGRAITVETFVKFVRHKLGGGHFDAKERKRWQRELMAMTRYGQDDKDFLNYHMKEVLRAVWEGVRENRIEEHVGEL